MYVLYLYDLKAKNKKSFNRTKRLFYYHLGRLSIRKDAWKTKSALAVPTKNEKMLDLFFRRFRRSVIVYKALVEDISELE
ncbi:MAG: hypothetical protein V1827_01890 [Candidatus Micrarchaeota archaeon]